MMINTIVGIVFTVIAFGFAYMSSHIIAERKAGKYIPLPWESKDDFKPDPKKNPDLGKGKFDKQRVAYRPEDNTWEIYG